MEQLSDRREALRELVDTATVEIWLSFSPGERHRSAVLDSNVLVAVGGLGLDVVLDAYPPGRRRRS